MTIELRTEHVYNLGVIPHPPRQADSDQILIIIAEIFLHQVIELEIHDDGTDHQESRDQKLRDDQSVGEIISARDLLLA